MIDYNSAPWLSSYGDRMFNLEYPKGSISDKVLETADEVPSNVALSYMGVKTTFKALKQKVLETAAAYTALGVRPGDKVTICLPNVPQAVFSLYALNYIGAIASMIHPLSAEGEIIFYIKTAGSRFCITLDQFAEKFNEVLKKTDLEKLIITGAEDELNFVKKSAYRLFIKTKKQKSVKTGGKMILWSDFIKAGKKTVVTAAHKKDVDPAVILFSGGTTGVTKGIMLSNLNFNALACQTIEMAHYPVRGAKMLAAMPVFHGFGLGVCIHTMMVAGGTSILVPRFNVKSYAELIMKNRPNFIAGVPTLFEALTRNQYLDKADLSCLKGVFSGGDSLSVELKKKFDAFLKSHNCSVRIREGYGTTECVTASCLTPYDKEKEGSIGIPYPDTYYMICKPGTTEPCAANEDGEICLRGPSVMLGYLDRPQETADTLRTHADGHVWLHTGDLGFMDEEGFIFFKQRIKRMIITSGYNVYPSQIENIIDGYPAVQMSCVIGVKDPYKMQKVKAFVVLKEGYNPDDTVKNDILEYCKKNIAKYAMPYDVEFRSELPKTLVGKVAYTVLEKEEAAKTA
ncbi:MAG: AMP-binding protein [Candidatus Borkfalkiaceae bacterium]|nr:AMP-binding protein [Christensenellaceae bacterium]